MIPPEDPSDNVGVITRIVHELLASGDAFEDEASLTAAVKGECARLHVLYSGRVVGAAIDSARVQRARRTAR